MEIIRIIIRALNILYLFIFVGVKRYPRNNKRYITREWNNARNSSNVNMLQLFISNIPSEYGSQTTHHSLSINKDLIDRSVIRLTSSQSSRIMTDKRSNETFITKWERRIIKRCLINLSETITYNVMKIFYRNDRDILPYTLTASSVIPNYTILIYTFFHKQLD